MTNETLEYVHYEIDINKLTEEQLQKHFNLAIMKAGLRFRHALKENILFQRHMYKSQYIASAMIRMGEDQFNSSCPGFDFNSTKKDFINDTEKYFNILNAKVYIDDYSNFESLISEIMSIIYWFFPKFLVNSEKFNSIINVPYEEIFINNNIELARKTIIELKIKDIIQGSNIKEIINKFKTLFGVKIDIDEDKIKRLITISNNRNILVHNKGYINKIYVNILKINNINPEFDIDNELVIDYTKYQNDSKLLEEIGECIFSHIAENIKQIQHYYTNKFRE